MSVKIQTIGTQASDITSGNASENSAGSGYMVDKAGNIELPMVGMVKVGGLTTTGAKEAIRKKADKYYKDPVVNVRLANFYVSVLGEVNRPAQYIIPNEKASVLDAIAMAGDLTIHGRRDNIMLIRDENGNKKATRFDLRSSDLYQNPYFYLRQGDVIYVEANKAKVAASDARMLRTVAIMTSVASLLVAVIYRLNF